MMIRTRLILVKNFSTTLSQYLTPYTNHIQPAPQIPRIKVRSQKQILKNWWSQPPIDAKQNLKVPIFNFHSNQYLGKSVELPKQIFNQPLRRDLIYRLHMYRSNLNKFRTKLTRNRAMTAGSGRKVRPQKKTGGARLGDKRAPHLRKGGKVHGAKPMVYSQHLNSKIKLKALCSLLTAKLVQGKIKIIDDEKISQPKTKVLGKIINDHIQDDRAVFCFITSTQVDQNFNYAYKNLRRVLLHDSYNLDVKSLFVADKIYITLKGLEQLINNIQKTKYIIYRQPYMQKLEQKKQQVNQNSQQLKWNPEKPYQFKFKILAEYLQLYEKAKNQNPQLLERELKKIRKIQAINSS